jgi:iron complex outermembrane receptor protein
MGVGYRQQLSSNGALNLVFSNFKNAPAKTFRYIDDKTNSGFRSTLNYKDTLWSVPLKPVWARRWL